MEEESRKFTPENIYETRGCSTEPKLEDLTRVLQMSSCAKMHITNWLDSLPKAIEDNIFDIVEVRFKNSHKEFFRITEHIKDYMVGDIVAVEAQPGHDIGIITLYGDIVKWQMKRRGISPDSESIKKVYRKARQTDIDKWNQTIKLEVQTQRRARELASSLGLDMKINSVEYQGDGSKAVFYYTAEDRVDFRQLIKAYAEEFRIRIEMRQIGARQEAGLLGGIGSCGREVCCATWKNTFHSVNTNVARAQQLSPNPQKLAGQCSKLKCCLNYEYEMYKEALQEFPDQNVILETAKGKAFCQKIELFEKTMFYSYDSRGGEQFELELNTVKEIISKNKKGDKVDGLEQYALNKNNAVSTEKKVDFENVVGQDDLRRFDTNKDNKKPKNRSNNNRNRGQERRDTRPDNRPNKTENRGNRNDSNITKVTPKENKKDAKN